MTVPIPGGEYLTTKEAVLALGISKATLYRRKNEGFFQRGVHYVTTGPSATSNFCGTSRKFVRFREVGKRRKWSDDRSQEMGLAHQQ